MRYKVTVIAPPARKLPIGGVQGTVTWQRLVPGKGIVIEGHQLNDVIQKQKLLGNITIEEVAEPKALVLAPVKTARPVNSTTKAVKAVE